MIVQLTCSLCLWGYDIVLGVQWLSTVSPILWDFQLRTMEFTKGSQTYKLIHSAIKTPLLLQEMTLQQLGKEFYALRET